MLDAIAAVALLGAGLPSLRLAIVGAGQDEARARELAKRLGIGHRILFPGWAEPAEVPSWLASADVVVAPSWQEGQGIAIIEAMAQARPVVATRTGGITDVVTDRVTGRLVEPARPDQIAEAIRELLASPREATAMGDRAALVARSQYGWSSTLDGFDDLYRRTIGSSR